MNLCLSAVDCLFTRDLHGLPQISFCTNLCLSVVDYFIQHGFTMKDKYFEK
jgi:hypothetical protein